jgi:cysteine synthase B
MAGAARVLDLIGDTPLVRLQRIVPAGHGEVWVKLEGLNPGGSVKDRAARHMVEQALAEGALVPGKTILDSTSGNTGIALAMIGAALGYPVELVVPANVSVERKKTLAAYGAVLHFSDPLTGSDGAILECRERFAADPERYWKADQYNNPKNPEAHYRTTGPEIWAQTEGRVTHFVASVGTSGTVMGTSRFLKEQSPAPQVIAVEPDDAFHGLEGMKHIASAIVPGIYDAGRLDRTLHADTGASYALTRRLALEEGILAGPSSGAAVLGALQVAAETGPSGCVVTLACDGGTRYLSTRVFEA